MGRTLGISVLLWLALMALPGQAEDPTIEVGHTDWEKALAWIGILILIALSGQYLLLYRQPTSRRQPSYFQTAPCTTLSMDGPCTGLFSGLTLGLMSLDMHG